MAAPRFHTLTVADIRRETPDAVSIGFDVPAELADDYRFVQGQYLTLRGVIGGEDIRRSYSICSGIDDGELRVAVKRVEGGRFSCFADERLKAGDTLDVMTPEGRFFVDLDPALSRRYLFFAAGSGITPVISNIKTILAHEPESDVTLVYGNSTAASVIFREELEDLKDRFLGRFHLYHVLSREAGELPLFSGRIDAEKCRSLLSGLIDAGGIDEVFVCGPQSMMLALADCLADQGIPRERIHMELFVVEGEPPPRPRTAPPPPAEGIEVTIVLDGRSLSFRTTDANASIVDAAHASGIDLPYSCKGGMCATCRARITDGAVEPIGDWHALEPDEIERGYALTCQSRPTSDKLTVDYDQR